MARVISSSFSTMNTVQFSSRSGSIIARSEPKNEPSKYFSSVIAMPRLEITVAPRSPACSNLFSAGSNFSTRFSTNTNSFIASIPPLLSLSPRGRRRAEYTRIPSKSIAL